MTAAATGITEHKQEEEQAEVVEHQPFSTPLSFRLPETATPILRARRRRDREQDANPIQSGIAKRSSTKNSGTSWRDCKGNACHKLDRIKKDWTAEAILYVDSRLEYPLFMPLETAY